MKPIIIIPCVGAKRDEPSRAKDMYTSQYFVNCRKYAELFGSRWYILSAKYGLIHPSRHIEPYDLTLSSMSSPELSEWSKNTFRQFVYHHNDPESPVIVVAGKLYRKLLIPLLRGYGFQVTVPFEGLGIGHQISTMQTLIECAYVIL